MERARAWCFTVWDSREWSELVGDKIAYVIVGEEVCPDTGKTHYQGYLECVDRMRFSAVKEMLGNTAHIEARKGSQSQAITYCKKDGKWVEFGEAKKQGKRTDLDKCVEMIDEGASDHEIMRSGVSWQAQKGLRQLRQMLVVPHGRKEKAEHRIMKSTWTDVNDILMNLEDDYDLMTYERGFWVGYTGKSTVVIMNDPREPKTPIERLLIVGRKTINTKGGESVFAPKVVIEIDLF